MLPISVVVPTRNESANLRRCLTALSDFDEVVVVDSRSADGTPQIAESCGARVLNFEWNGRYPKKRNWVLLNVELQYPWVLFVDADEVVTEAFVTEMARAVANDKHVGFWLNYSTYFMGRRLRYGVGQKKLALFKVKSGLYEGIDETRWTDLDMEVHEHPLIKGSVGEIKAKIEHNDFKSLEKYIERHNAYSTWEARRAAEMDKAETWRRLTTRQKLKYILIGRTWFPFMYFLVQYVLLGGVFDGREGYFFAMFKCFYFLQVQTKLLELRMVRQTQ
jgi:glycosyltransferase involved in cell wall biosynthesis